MIIWKSISLEIWRNDSDEITCSVIGISPVTDLFSYLKRSVKSGEILVSDCRFDQNPIIFSENSIGVSESLHFIVNKSVNLIGVRLFGIKGESFDVTLTITKENAEENLCEMSSLYNTEKELTDGLYYGFTVTLDKPVKLDRGCIYTIYTKIFGKCCWVKQDAKPIVSAGEYITIVYKDSTGSQYPSLVLQTI